MERLNQPKTNENYGERRPPNVCPLCAGIGFQLIEINGHNMARKCRCLSPERIRNLQMRSGIPDFYWKDSLNNLQPKTLQEIAWVESLQENLHKRDLPLMHSWIDPAQSAELQKIVLSFANDLIQVMGHSCLWIDCQSLARVPARTNPAHLENFDASLALQGDVVFISHYQPELLRAKTQRWLEDVVQYRLRHHKSTIFLGTKPEGYRGFQNLFQEPALGIAIMKKFKMLEPGKNDLMEPHPGWLF